MSTAAKAHLSIGEVLGMLRQDFPDITISKIRFLEAEGLVEPERTSAGYRKFSRDDVARLRYILSAQRDHYLPLRVIRENLAAMDRGMAPPSTSAPAPRPALSAVPDPVERALPNPADFALPMSELRMSRDELLTACGLDDEQLRELEGFDLLGPVPGGEFYDADALAIAQAAAGMAVFGVDARHLRTLRLAADREIALIRQVITPIEGQRSPESRAKADEVTRELAALSIALRTALVRSGLTASRTR
jgi:DNA-binding transcriptional MerR regulator